MSFVRLLKPLEVPAKGASSLRRTMGGFAYPRTLPRGTVIPASKATNIPQAGNAIRYWVDLPELKGDGLGVGLYDGDFELAVGPTPQVTAIKGMSPMGFREENPGTREIGSHVHDYGSAYSFLVGHNNRRKLANNTTVERIGDHTMNRMMLTLKESASDVIAVVLHNTYIVAYTSDGRILLNSGGYQTTTTKQRLNQLLPPGYGIMQKDFAWYVTTPSGKYPFEDGAMLYPGAQMEYETPDGEKPYASNPKRHGKFYDDLDAAVWQLTMDGPDADFGDVDEYGMYVCILRDIGPRDLERAVADSNGEYTLRDLSDDLGLSHLTTPFSAVASTDSDGFVTVDKFQTVKEADRAFNDEENRYVEWIEGHGE